MDFLNVNILCITASYLVAFGLEWTRLIGKRSIGQPIMLLVGLAGFIAHTMYLFERATQANLPPLLSSTHDWLLVLAWLAILFYLFLSALQRDIPIGMFLLPLVLILIGSAYVVGDVPSTLHARDPQIEQTALRRHWAMLHSSLLVLGMAGVILGFVLSMMYLVQHRRLKHKQTMYHGMTLPSLARLARLNWWAIVVSVPLLTLGMLSGIRLIFLSKYAPDPISWSDPIVVASGIVWLVMVSFFGWLLWTPRPAGKQVAWLTILAFGFLLATILGLQMLTGGHEAANKPVPRKNDTVQSASFSPLSTCGRGAGGEGALIPGTKHWRTSRQWHPSNGRQASGFRLQASGSSRRGHVAVDDVLPWRLVIDRVPLAPPVRIRPNAKSTGLARGTRQTSHPWHPTAIAAKTDHVHGGKLS